MCKDTRIASSASSMSLSGDGTNTETTASSSTSAHSLPTKSHFFLSKSVSNWTNAEDSCKQINGHLASILNQTEEHTVRELIVGTDDCRNGWWIGLKWEPHFTWSDQSPFKNFKSITSEADNNKPCFYIHKMRKDIELKPESCEHKYCFVCKYTWIASSASSLSGDGTNTETTAFISTSAHPLPTKSRTLRTTYATISTSFTPTPISSTISRMVPLSGLIISPINSPLLYNEFTSTPFSLTLVPSTTSTKKGSDMPIKRTDAGTSSAGVSNSHIDTEITLPTVALSPTIKGSSAGTASPDVGNSQLYAEITSTTVDLPPVLSPTINRSGADTSSAGLIGGSVAGVCVAMAIVSVVLYVCCRKRKHSVTRQRSLISVTLPATGRSV